MTSSRRGTRFGLVLIALLLLLSAEWGALGGSRGAEAGSVLALTGAVHLDLAANPFGYVGLIDLSGFVRRDVAYLQGDSLIAGWIDHATGDYQIDLPTEPAGTFNQVAPGLSAGPGVQIYSLDWLVDFTGDARLGPWDFAGWSWGNTSLRTRHGDHEITGGQLVIWTPDGNEFFPTGFGDDGKLFTADDPLGPIPAGWSVVDLDEAPFALLRDKRVTVGIEPGEFAPDDLSQLPATQAFDQLINLLRARYPYGNDLPVDWEGLRATYRPEFAAAELSGERVDFWIALNHFLVALHNWQYFAVYPHADAFLPRWQGSTGLNVEVTDDQRVIVIRVEPGLPAAEAGIQPGAELLTWDGIPARQAVAQNPVMIPESSAQAELFQQTGSFGRAPVGTVIPVTFRNPGAAESAAVSLQAVEIPGETVGLSFHCFHVWFSCTDLAPPVEAKLLPSKIAVINVRGISDSVRVRAEWDATLDALNRTDATGLIIDVRGWSDSLGAPAGPPATVATYLAGSFFAAPFPLADVTSVDANGQNVTVGKVSVLPAPVQWTRPVAVVVDEQCKGACDLFVLAMSHLPGVMIAGMSATGGSLGGQMEPVLLPTGNFVLIVDTAYRDPVTGAVLVEGKGTSPTLRVPKTVETLLAAVAGDPVRDAAEQALFAASTVVWVTPTL